VHPDQPQDAWGPLEIEPTTLIALWPGQKPAMTRVLAAFGAFLNEDIRIVAEADTDDQRILWNVVVELPGLRQPVIVWSEPARKLSRGELDDPAASACRWIIGLETTLDPGDPFTGFAGLMRLLAGTSDELSAVLDANSGRWHTRQALDEHFRADAEAPEDVLWMTHVVGSAADDEGPATTWLHTHGLWRCGRPELEMIGVPDTSADEAAELLAGIAGRILEEGMPSPGKPFAVGPGLDVTFQPWQAVAPFVGDAPGGRVDRAGEPDSPHTGVRAVVCDPKPKGAYRKTWTWPQEALERIRRGEGTLFLSRRETLRLAGRAQARWPDFTGAFATLGPRLRQAGADLDRARVRFLVKAAFTENAPGNEREHLWFAVRRFEGDRARGELLNEPSLTRSLSRGDVTWIERQAVSDWSVVTPLGSFGPGDTGAMSGALEAIAGKAEAGA
jgi:hypothetical protein